MQFVSQSDCQHWKRRQKKIHLIDKNPEEDYDPRQVSGSKDDGQAKVDDDLGQVGRTRHVAEPVTLGYGVSTPALPLQLGKDHVCFQLK